MIPEDKYFSDETFNWKGADIAPCREKFGNGRLTSYCSTNDLYFIRSTDEDKTGFYMLNRQEFHHYYHPIDAERIPEFHRQNSDTAPTLKP